MVTQLFKIPVTFSGKNYLPRPRTPELEAEGYSYFGTNSRIRSDEIMKIKQIGLADRPDHISYEVFFLEGQKDEAVAKMKAFIDERVGAMQKQINALAEAWKTRKERPKNPYER